MSNGEKKEWKYDEATRLALEEFIKTEDLTQVQVATRMNLGTSRVNKYLHLNEPGRIPETDMPKVESAVKSMLRHARRRSAFKSSLFENSITKFIVGELKATRRHGDMSVIHGPAGIGKTCGAEIFCRDYSTSSILLTARQYAQGSSSLEAMMMDEYITTSGRKWPGNVRPMLWLEREMRGANWFLIVDGAHKLHLSAFHLLCDFHDATGIPIGTIGNPEVLRTIAKNDQVHSRFGQVSDVAPDNEYALTARQMIAQWLPASGDELVAAAEDVVTREGHARRLKKQLVMTETLFEKEKDWVKAFNKAATKLIKAGGGK